MRTKIYVLIDPRDKGVRYVGKTKRSLEARLGAHCSTWLKNVSEACRKTVQKRKQQRFFKLLTSSIKARF